MLRVIREIRPRWVVGENVLGIVSWDGGLVFEQVHADLEDEGYEVQAFVLPACSVGAPHLRYRTWFVAHAIANSECYGGKVGESEKEGTEIRKFGDAGAGSSDGIHIQERTTSHPDSKRGYMSSGKSRKAESIRRGDNGEPKDGSKQTERDHGLPDVSRTIAYSNSERREECNIAGQSERTYIAGRRSDEIQDRWSNFPTQSTVRSRDDGFPVPMDGITLPKWRAESIKAYGNAIVPHVAYRIFEAINKYEAL